MKRFSVLVVTCLFALSGVLLLLKPVITLAATGSTNPLSVTVTVDFATASTSTSPGTDIVSTGSGANIAPASDVFTIRDTNEQSSGSAKVIVSTTAKRSSVSPTGAQYKATFTPVSLSSTEYNDYSNGAFEVCSQVADKCTAINVSTADLQNPNSTLNLAIQGTYTEGQATNPSTSLPAGCSANSQSSTSTNCPPSQTSSTNGTTGTCGDGSTPTNGKCADGSTPVDCTNNANSQNSVCQNAGSAASIIPKCESTGGPFSWIFCAAIGYIADAEQNIEKVIDNILQTNPFKFDNSQCSTTNPNACIYSVWSQFRIYGDIVLVIALLAVVFAEAAGGGLIDAYTAKKMLPRILVAAILINLSIYIVAGLEDVFNILGKGIEALIAQPFQHLKLPNGQPVWQLSVGGVTGTGGFTLGLLGVGGLLLGLWAGGGLFVAIIALMVVLPALLAALGVVIVLILRTGILSFLILVSPIAFALYVLPNTEQYFKRWWKLLAQTLMVYPIVSLVFAMANITAVILSGPLGNLSGPSGNGNLQWLGQAMGALAMIAPLFLIPFAFRISGGAIGAIQGQVGNLVGRANGALRGLGRRQAGNLLQRAREDRSITGDSALTQRRRRTAQTLALAGRAGFRPWRWRANMVTARGNVAHHEIERNEKENADYTWGADGDMNRAAAESDNEAELRARLHEIDPKRFQGLALDEAVSRIQRMRRGMGAEAFRQMTTLHALAAGNTYLDHTDANGVFHSGTAEAWEAVAKAAGNDDAALGALTGQARTLLMQAGHVDQGGASYGVSLAAASRMRDELRKTGTVSDATKASVARSIHRSAIESSEVGQAIRGKPSSAEHLAQAHADRIQEIVDGIQAGTHTQRDLDIAYADVMGLHDAMSAASPQNGRAFADALMNAQVVDHVNGGQMSVYDLATDETTVTNPGYAQRRRDYSSGYQAEAARAAQAAAAGAAPPPPGGGAGSAPAA